MIEKIKHIDELFDKIVSYDRWLLNVVTMRCKIDYIRCSEDLRLLYPEIFSKLEDRFKKRDVSFIYEPNDEFPDKYAVECGNKNEFYNLLAIPKINGTSFRSMDEIDGIDTILSVEFKRPIEFSEEEVEDYKDKLTLIIEIDDCLRLRLN